MQRYTVSEPGGNAAPQLMELMNLECTQRRSGVSFTQALLRYTRIKAKRDKTGSSSLTENRWTDPLTGGGWELEFQRKHSIPTTVPSPSVCSCLYRTRCLPHGRKKCSVLWSSEGNMTLLISLKTAAHLFKKAPQAAPSSSL